MSDDPLASADFLTVSHDPGFIGMFRLARRFNITAPAQNRIVLTATQERNWRRLTLVSIFSYTLDVLHPDGSPYLRVHAPPRSMRRETEVSSADGKLLGRISKRFTLVSTRYDVLDAQGTRRFEIARDFMWGWTFRVLRDGSEVARIAKRWSGFTRELFTQPDRFQLQFGDVHDIVERRLLLGAGFFIDLRHFEDSGGG